MPELRLSILVAVVLLAATVSPAHAAASPPISFAPAVTYPSLVASSHRAAVADVTGDGRPDVVTAGSQLLVWPGTGGGALGVPSPYAPPASWDVGLAVGDLNGDGWPDAVMGLDVLRGAVAVFLGNGHGGLADPAEYATGTPYEDGERPVEIVIGDVSGDGNADLVTANLNGRSTSVLLGNGDGTFQPATIYPVPSFGLTDSVATADLNGDGNPDLVAGHAGTGISVRLGTGGGAFGPATDYTVGNGYATSLRTADFDGDGKVDLVFADSTGVEVLLGKGDGTFQPPTGYALTAGSSTVTIADLNGDGDLDLAVGSITTGNVTVLVGGGDGTFQAAAVLPAGFQTESISAADMGQDGRYDLVAVGQFGVTVLSNTTPASAAADTHVAATVAPTLTVRAPASLAFPPLPVGGTSEPVGGLIVVICNAHGGYQLSASRSQFTGGDIPLSLALGPPGSGQTADVSGFTPIPTSGSLSVGHRSGSSTTGDGDSWGAQFRLGPVPFVSDGLHTSTVTLTAVTL